MLGHREGTYFCSFKRTTEDVCDEVPVDASVKDCVRTDSRRCHVAVEGAVRLTAAGRDHGSPFRTDWLATFEPCQRWESDRCRKERFALRAASWLTVAMKCFSHRSRKRTRRGALAKRGGILQSGPMGDMASPRRLGEPGLSGRLVDHVVCNSH